MVIIIYVYEILQATNISFDDIIYNDTSLVVGNIIILIITLIFAAGKRDLCFLK